MKYNFEKNTQSNQKRFYFVAEILRRRIPERVLDIGCGTGEELTIPLASEFPNIKFFAEDSDQKTIEYASEVHSAIKNITFLTNESTNCRFQVIIASEVIEHVFEPHNFLITLLQRLDQNGCLILTLPNGYGSLELLNIIENGLIWCGLIKFLSSLKQGTSSAKNIIGQKDTLANSPHINFFSHKEILHLFASLSLKIKSYSGRMLFHGFGISQLINIFPGLVEWNMRVADQIPPNMVADWMFELEQGFPINEIPDFRRNIYSRIKGKMNCFQMGLPYTIE